MVRFSGVRDGLELDLFLAGLVRLNVDVGGFRLLREHLADKANLDTAMIEAVREMFAKKAKAADINIEAYKTGKEKIEFKSVPNS